MTHRRVERAEVEFFSDLVCPPPDTARLDADRLCCVDVAYRGDSAFAAAVVLEGSAVAEVSNCTGHPTFPYIPGLFYLREGPFAVGAVRALKSKPGLVCFDGHGLAHPKLNGMATVCGRVLGIPSIGVAKSLLHGFRAADDSRIYYRGRVVGYRTVHAEGNRYWSPGFSISLNQLLRLIRTRADVILQGMANAHAASRTLAVSSRS